MPDGRVSETRYTSFGKEDRTLEWRTVADFESATDSLARVTVFGYDNAGNLTLTTFPDSSTEAAGYDAEGRRLWSQDRLGRRTFVVYDKVGRQRFTILPDANDGVGAAAPSTVDDPRLSDNPRSETVYDLAGRVLKQIDVSGRVTENKYYADGTPDAGRRQQVILGSGSPKQATTSYQYDKTGAVRYVTDPRNNVTETQYDNQGRVRFVIYPATDEHPATQTETTYDALGRRQTVTDQEGKPTIFSYDALGRLRSVLDALSHTTSYTYDELGSQVTQTDALNRTTTYWTDGLGRRTKRILPKDTLESTALYEQVDYDEWGNLWHRRDFAGLTSTYTYDTLGRLKTKAADATHPSLVYGHAIARVEYDYDAIGARTAARTYNASSVQLYSESTPRTERGAIDYKQTPLGTLDYDYFAGGELKDVVSSNTGGVNIGYRYDDLGRLEYVDDATTGPVKTTSYTYNANGSLATASYANGIQHAYNYDTLNRLRTLNLSLEATSLRGYEYKLRASGHRRQIIEATGRTATYAYDDLYRLTGETITGDPVGQNGTIGYDLDDVGNRRNRTSTLAGIAAQSNRTYNARDWLNGDTYDSNGNTTNGLLSAGASSADVYDFENHLILRTKSDGSSINLAYDADGNRIQKTILNASAQVVSASTYLVDTNNLTGYAQVVEEQTSVGGLTPSSTKKVYTYGSDLISSSEIVNGESSTANFRYFVTDGLGSVRGLVNESGVITDTYTYDAFGTLVSKTGTSDNVYLYRGEQWDADLGLYYNRARYLNADSGRFWNADSYEGSKSDPASLHKYLYANSNPLRFGDPSGHMSLGEISMAMAINATLSVALATPKIISHWGEMSASEIAAKLGKEAAGGAISGLIGGTAGKIFLKAFAPGLTWLFGKAVLEGAAGAGIQQFAKEVWGVLNGEPLQIKSRSGRIFIASVVGGAAGAITFKIKPYLEPLVSKAFSGGYRTPEGFTVSLPWLQFDRTLVSWYGVTGTAASEATTDWIQDTLDLWFDLDAESR